jgi:hypothetical protein
MRKKVIKLDFYSVATTSAPPKGEYASAREQLADLPAIIFACFGEDGARTVAWLVAPHKKNSWRRSDRGFFERQVAFAARALHNADLSPEMRAHFTAIVLTAAIFDAVEKEKKVRYAGNRRQARARSRTKGKAHRRGLQLADANPRVA